MRLETASTEHPSVQYNGEIQGHATEAEGIVLDLSEVMCQVFGDLSLLDLRSAARVCHLWRAIVRSGDEAVMRKFAKGAADWVGYGEVREPPIPIGIAGAWRDHYLKFGSMAKLFFSPETVGGEEATLDKLVELARIKFGVDYYTDGVKARLGRKAVQRPGWVLATADILDRSENESMEDKREMVKELGPDCVLLETVELVAAGLLGLKFPWSVSADQTECLGGKRPVVVGWYSSGRLCVDEDGDNCGVVAAWKF